MKKIKFLASVLIIGAALFTAAYISGIGNSLTGFLVLEQQTSVSVDEDTKVDIQRFDFNSFIDIGNYTTIYTEIANSGSVPVEGNFTISISNINNTLLWEYPNPTREIPPGGHYKRSTRHSPQEVGDYIVRLQARFAGEVQEVRRFLAVRDIQEPEPETITRTVTITRTNTIVEPAPPRPETPPPSWNVEAPNQITLEEEGSSLVPINVENTGEVTIDNVRMSLAYSSNLTVDHRPPVFFGILSNDTKTFLLDVQVKEGVLENQEIRYSLKSEELREKNAIDIDIQPNMTVRRLENKIESIERLVSQAEAKISSYNRTGEDMSIAKERLNDTRESLNTARNSLEEKDLESAERAIGNAEKSISSVFQNIFKLRSGEVVVRAPLVKPIYILIFASIAASILLVSLYYYFREKHERRPKLLREK